MCLRPDWTRMLSRMFWAHDRGAALSRSDWLCGRDAALSRSLWAHGRDAALSRLRWAHGRDAVLSRSLWAHSRPGFPATRTKRRPLCGLSVLPSLRSIRGGAPKLALSLAALKAFASAHPRCGPSATQAPYRSLLPAAKAHSFRCTAAPQPKPLTLGFGWEPMELGHPNTFSMFLPSQL